MARQGKVDGNNVLYHYLQHSLQQEDVWLYQMLVARLVVALGIWFPPEAFRRLPIALPFVVRDTKCRRPVDQWSAPNEQGYLRDDNSMVKNLVSSLGVRKDGFREYQGRRLGPGFIAAHVWRETTGDVLASRIATTNTFLPNLVWLPSNVAKLTDREGSFAQTYVQAIATKIYRNIDVGSGLQPLVDEAWALLPEPPAFPEQALPSESDLTYFDVTDAYIQKAISRIEVVSGALELVGHGSPVEGKVVSSRYTAGLSDVPQDNLRRLADWLSDYLDALG